MDDAGVWTPNPRLADSSVLAEFCEVIWGMERNITAVDQNPETRNMSFRVSIKQISVDLRKLLSDGLLMRSISSPKLHRLRPASGRDGTKQVIQHQDEDGLWTSLNEGLKLYALPGWDFRGVAALQFSTDVFQVEGRASLNWERWKKQPVLIAGPKGAEQGFSLEDILSYAWSAYGAHFDDGNPKRADSKKGKHWPYLDFVRNREFGLNYPLFLSLAVGCYIRNQAVQSYYRRYDDWVRLCGDIPRHSAAPLHVSGACNMEIYAPMNYSQSGSDVIGLFGKRHDLNDILAIEAKLPPSLPRSDGGGWAMRSAVRQ